MGKKTNYDGNDWISNMCDDILIRILSLLTTKDAVGTCILSKRWSRVWTFVPVLKFYVHEFSKNASRSENNRICEDRLARFVDGVLRHRGTSPLETFNYFCVWTITSRRSIEWMDRVTSLMPRVISVHCDIPCCSYLPDSIFSCASLEELKLLIFPDCRKHSIVQSINLPSLKVLDLGEMRLSDVVINKIFSGCPVLERLIFLTYYSGMTDITSDRLKELDIICRVPKKVNVSCPSLVSLSSVFTNAQRAIIMDNMPALENAAIRLYKPCDLLILNVLRGLSNASSIKLDGDSLFKGLLEKDICNCRTFNNLKKLEIGRWDMINDFSLIACFLKKSPNLQELSLQIYGNNAYVQEEPREQAKGVAFVREYLDTVKISYGTEMEQAKLVEVLRRHIRTIGNVVFHLTSFMKEVRVC